MNRLQENKREGVIFWIQYSDCLFAVDIVDLSDVRVWMVTCFIDNISKFIYACAFAKGEYVCGSDWIIHLLCVCQHKSLHYWCAVMLHTWHRVNEDLRDRCTCMHSQSYSIKSNVLSCFLLFSSVNKWEISIFCTCLAFMLFLFEDQMSVQSQQDSIYA